ncbi:MAG TPA: M48 family metalloprotease, partial [Phycisphaerae bacterium]|nr:M48 family metalloprotease [Phycisphaerae bacterium]
GVIGATLGLIKYVLRGSDAELAVFLGVAVLVELIVVALILRTFMVKLPAPNEYVLKPGEGEPLRALIDGATARAGLPPVDVVHIYEGFNAGVTQIPRYGWWGRSRSHLLLGVPLLMALSPEDFEAVVAHELGHLRGGHARMSWWAYRVHRTWTELGKALDKSKRLQRVVIGWFVERYGALLERETLALRRLHEYEADRFSVEQTGQSRRVRAFFRIAFLGYRLERQFWPGIVRLAGWDPVPPGDVFARMADFFATEPGENTIRRWVSRAQRARTPITADHPALCDRLAAIDAEGMLSVERCRGLVGGIAPESAALALLGEDGPRIVSLVTMRWKQAAIGRWRLEHGYARHIERRAAAADEPEADAAWRRVEHTALFGEADEAQAAAGEVLARYPDHAPANLALGQILLEQDEPAALGYLDRAAAQDGKFAARALTAMLEYHRDLGEDEAATRVAERLHLAERRDRQFDRVLASVSARDAFGPAELSASELDELRRVLYRHARVRSAYLARRIARAAPERTSHVLLLRCRAGGMGMNERTVASLREEAPVPCAVVVSGWSNRRLGARIRRVAPVPVFEAGD